MLLWGWGVMNSTALKEAVATGYPREKMYGVWWAAAEPDVKDVGDGAKGYNGLALQHGAEPNSKVVKDVLTQVHGKGQGTGPKEEVGSVLYMRGLMSAMLGDRRRPARAGALRQGQVDERRAGALGPREPDPRPEEARRARLRRRDAADLDLVRRPHGRRLGARAHLGRHEVERSPPTGMQADDAIIKPMVKNGGRRSTPARRSSTRARRRTAKPERLPTGCRRALPPLPPEGGALRGALQADRAMSA